MKGSDKLKKDYYTYYILENRDLRYSDFGVRVGRHVFIYFSMFFFHIW